MKPSLSASMLPQILETLRAKGLKPRRVRGGWQATCPCCGKPGALTITTTAIQEHEGPPAPLVVAGRAGKQVMT